MTLVTYDRCAPGAPVPAEELVKLQANTIEWQNQELLRKNRDIKQLRDRVAELHEEITKLRKGAPASAYDVLLMIANDPAAPLRDRRSAAEAAVQFERPKLSATMSHNTNVHAGLADALDAAKRREARLKLGLHVIEGEPVA